MPYYQLVIVFIFSKTKFNFFNNRPIFEKNVLVFLYLIDNQHFNIVNIGCFFNFSKTTYRNREKREFSKICCWLNSNKNCIINLIISGLQFLCFSKMGFG